MQYFSFRDLFQFLHTLFFCRTIDYFENLFSQYLGVKYSIGTSYGRTALYLALESINVKDREVLLPNFTCTVVKQAVQSAGATPVYVNINKDSLTFDLKDLYKKVNSNTKAIILTHYYGMVARNFSDILSFISDHNLILIEDCAHSLGAEFNGQKIGTIGHFGIFSLTKSLVNLGGGVLVTNDENFYQRALQILDNFSISTENRINDKFTMLSYGLEQFITKFFLEHSINLPYKFNLLKIVKLPFFIRKITVFPILRLIKFISKFFSCFFTFSKTKFYSYSPHYHGLKISKLIAALATVQLKRFDTLRNYRITIYSKLKKLFSRSNDLPIFLNKPNDAFSFLVLFDSSIFAPSLSSYFQKNHNLLFKTTWPNRQSFDSYRFTTDLTALQNHMLTISLHPGLTDSDIQLITDVFYNYKRNSNGSIQANM